MYVNINFPTKKVTEFNGRIIYATTEWGAVGKLPSTATIDEKVAAGIYLVVREPLPTYDPAIERLGPWEGPVLDNVAGTATYSRSVVALTQAEIDARVEVEAQEVERQQLKTAYLLFKNNQATAAQVQRAIAYLIKENAG